MKICIKCGLVIAPEIEKAWDRNSELRNVCPSVRCAGSASIIDVDEAIAPIICELNRKGYATEFSCAGHFYEYALTPYVMFDHINTGETVYPSFEDLKRLTQYHWYFDIDDHNTWGSNTIRYAPCFDNSDIRIARIEQTYAMEKLHAWVSSLPEAWVGGDNFRISRLSYSEVKELEEWQNKCLIWDDKHPMYLKLPESIEIPNDPSPCKIKDIIEQAIDPEIFIEEFRKKCLNPT